MAEKCGDYYEGSVMIPLEYPAVGWEPVRASGKCCLQKGHDGDHEARDLLVPGDKVTWK